MSIDLGSNAKVKLAAANMLNPLQQGELDGLCGLYAIVNALRLAVFPGHSLTDAQTYELFAAGVSWLDGRGLLASVVQSGMSQRVWRELMVHVTTELPNTLRGAISFQRLIKAGNAASLTMAYARITAACERGCPVLALVYDSYDHFTVISGTTASRLVLFDSYGFHWLNRQSCSLVRGTAARHRLAPRALIAVQFEHLHEV